ncbi:MAG TPA: serine hydrolase domain-containing protein [Candidatus Dormibacteraeota bacterium]|nr:serine hydrolase domain-containing protein [Candidatus Dormibacteraeota bacterium]
MRRSTQHFTLLISTLATLALFGCGGAPQQQPLPPTPTSLSGLQQAIQTILSRDGVPGAGIALVNQDKVIWAGGVGVSRLSTGKPMSADTMFRVGPVTQTFVSLALLQLQEQKKIDLNAKLADIAPTLPFQNPWRATNPVTVADVLENTAGFDATPASEAYDLNGPEGITPFDLCLRFPEPLVSRWPPGTRMSNSQPGYGVAGYLIWKASGLQFDQYIDLNILQPLGMTQSGFTLTDKIFAQLAQGYHGNPPRPAHYLNIYLRPAGDLKSSPAEMAKLVQMFLNGGKAGKQQIVSPPSIARMEYPQTTLAARAGLRDGYGLANESILNGPVVQHGLAGGPARNADGYLSSFGYMPGQGVGYVALINNDSGASALRSIDELLARYLVAGQTVPQPPSAAVAPLQLQPLTGYYEKENPPSGTTAFLERLLGGAHVSLSGDQLYLKEGWFGTWHALIPTGNNQFRLQDQAAASMIFFPGPSGNEILASGAPRGFFGRQRGVLWPLIRFILVDLALLAILSSFAFALWWIPRKLMGKMKETANLSLRAMPLLAGLSLLGAALVAAWTPVYVLGTYNMASVSIWLLTWLFAAFSVLGLILAWPAHWKTGRRAVFWHSLVVSAACCGLTIYMAYWHLLGIRLWNP